MPRGGAFAMGAVAGMMFAGLPGYGSAMVPTPGAILVAVCGDHAHLVGIPVKRGDGRRLPCPTGCHAVCTRRDAADGEE